MAADDDERTEEPSQRKLAAGARERRHHLFGRKLAQRCRCWRSPALSPSCPARSSPRRRAASSRSWPMPDQFSTNGDALRGIALAVMIKVCGIFSLAGLALGCAALASRYLQDQPTFTAERLSPKLDKLNPAEGFKRVFGKAAFAQFTKSLIKLAVVGACLVSALWPHDASLERISLMDPSALLPFVQAARRVADDLARQRRRDYCGGRLRLHAPVLHEQAQNEPARDQGGDAPERRRSARQGKAPPNSLRTFEASG